MSKDKDHEILKLREEARVWRERANEAEAKLQLAHTKGARVGWIQSVFFHSGIPEDGSVSVAIEARTSDEMNHRWPLPGETEEPTVTPARDPDDTADETPSRRRRLDKGSPLRRKIT